MLKREQISRSLALPLTNIVEGDRKNSGLGAAKYVVYEASSEDLKEVETRVVNTVSFFVDKLEKLNRMKDYFTIADRFQMCHSIL